MRIFTCKPTPGRAQHLNRYCVKLSALPLVTASLSGISNTRRTVQSSSSSMADPVLNNGVSSTSTAVNSREWVLAPVLEQVLLEMVDSFLHPKPKRKRKPKDVEPPQLAMKLHRLHRVSPISTILHACYSDFILASTQSTQTNSYTFAGAGHWFYFCVCHH